jgi:hypothetical protein
LKAPFATPTRKKGTDRRAIIEAVRTPLSFFVLVVLVIEVTLAAIVGGGRAPNPTPLIYGMVAALFFMICVVAWFAYYRPEALTGVRPSESHVVLPEAKDFGIVITHPASDIQITEADVGGTIKKDIPQGYTLWVFREYKDNGFWPVLRCVVNMAKRTWEAPGCDIGGGKSGEHRWFSVNLVGADGAALIEYMKSANKEHKKIRDQLSSLGKTDLPNSPLIYRRTHDMLECQRVRLRLP